MIILIIIIIIMIRKQFRLKIKFIKTYALAAATKIHVSTKIIYLAF